MKKVKIPLDDLLTVLSAMKDSEGTTDIIFFEYNGYPAIADFDEPDNVVTFASVNEEGEVNAEDEQVH